MTYNLSLSVEPDTSLDLDIYQNVKLLEAQAIKQILRNGLFRGEDFSIPQLEKIVANNNTILADTQTELDKQITHYIEQVGILTFVRYSLALKIEEDLIGKFVKIAERDYEVKNPLDIHIVPHPNVELNENNIHYFTKPAEIHDVVNSGKAVQNKIRNGLQNISQRIRKALKKDCPPTSADYFEFTAFYDFDATLFDLNDFLKNNEYVHLAEKLQDFGVVGIKVPEMFELK